MSSLTFWREFSPVSVQSHAPVAILLSTAQCNVDVPIHSLCDHHDVMMLSGRNGISYKNIIAGKKKEFQRYKKTQDTATLSFRRLYSSNQVSLFLWFFTPPLCSIGDQMLSRGLPSNSFQLLNFKVSLCNPGQSLIFSSSSSLIQIRQSKHSKAVSHCLLPRLSKPVN